MLERTGLELSAPFLVCQTNCSISPNLDCLPGSGLEILCPLLEADEVRRELGELLILLDHCKRISETIQVDIQVSQCLESERILGTQPVGATEIFQGVVVPPKYVVNTATLRIGQSKISPLLDAWL